MNFKKDTSAGYLANHMARLFASGLQRRIKPLGLSPGQFPALVALWAKEGRTQKELVELLDIEQATLANTLARMERDGLISRRASEEDGRVQQIFLTDRAKSLEEEAIGAALAQNAEALAGFSESERDQFLDYMRRAIAAMQSAETGSAE
ncbi:MarR family winged helix-turn-helix transcriptional regulator [Roseibium sediminicola]|uniref:MarR family transcriptional regulator n=1 Tax=Roseibium sediminicola TaxID=2933272 RepID=A0ABT0GSM8_9HYPH|nr:MarR family transcriptional regulator [Roseibium sp. CAU 1639]MCK7612456.1 MarR family transcriptional regulator [Roseibium sp. CAU 1639]